MEKFKTRQELADSMGISYPTFYRKMKEKNIKIPKGLIAPDVQEEIKQKYGFKSQQGIPKP